MADTYKTVLLQQRPKDDIILDQTFKFQTQPIPKESDLQDKEVLIEILYLSLDPAMRTWLDEERSYTPPVALGEVMRGGALSRVVASKSPSFNAGDLVTGFVGWREYAVVSAENLIKVQVPEKAQATDMLGLLGLTGLTAYFGLLSVGNPQAGELVVVSGAAGATGSVVCQIAKIKGARVVAIAGDKDKVAWLKELGVDVALNYKDHDFRERFHDATKDHIDVYFDNVGGEILDLALGQAKEHARFVMCGMISQYNVSEPRGWKNQLKIVTLRVKMQGFIVMDFLKEWPAARKELAGWLAEGKLQRKEHVIRGGLDAAPKGLQDLFRGINTGKLMVEVKKP